MRDVSYLEGFFFEVITIIKLLFDGLEFSAPESSMGSKGHISGIPTLQTTCSCHI